MIYKNKIKYWLLVVARGGGGGRASQYDLQAIRAILQTNICTFRNRIHKEQRYLFTNFKLLAQKYFIFNRTLYVKHYLFIS